MAGLASVIEEAIRYPGFAFVNVQSPCVTFGRPEAQLRQHKEAMKKLADLGHDPKDNIAALRLAQDYGRELYTGVFYRDPEPGPTYEALVAERHAAASAQAVAPDRILDLFAPR
jgi:2-oxoglutarate ferredoxin oxidoreductase subunit beta